MTYSENFNLNKQMNNINYSDGFKAIPMLPKRSFFALPVVIFLLWIFLNVLTQFTFVNGINNATASSGINGMKKSQAATALVFNDPAKGYSSDLIHKSVFILRDLK